MAGDGCPEKAKPSNYIVYYYHCSITLYYYNTNISKYMACFPGIFSQPPAVCGSESPEPEVIPLCFIAPDRLFFHERV